MVLIQTAAIVSSGDELVSGRTIDTNSGFIAEQLIACGIEITVILVAGDDKQRLEWAFAEALGMADLVISTGGLGPTTDDLTSDAVAQMAKLELVLDREIANRIQTLFAAMGREMPKNNLRQARIPRGATIIPNQLGTAPGYRLALEHAGRVRHLVVLPGVPREMKAMMKESVLPWVSQCVGGDAFASRVFQTFGLTESGLSQLLAGLEHEARLSYRANFPEVSVRVTIKGQAAALDNRLEQVAVKVREHLGGHLISEGENTMEAVVGELLKARGLTLAVAESCTGGLIGHRITNVPGSSAYMRGVIVAYCDEVKLEMLAVAPATIAIHGAVSEETVREMAAGIRRSAAAEIGLATTGIAGPGGARPGKPVGTVCIGLDTPTGAWSRRYQLWGGREWIKLLTSQIALDWVRRYLLDLPPLELRLGGGVSAESDD